jgi:hypothetical protein
VTQNNERAFALLGEMHPHPIGLNESVTYFSHVSFSCLCVAASSGLTLLFMWVLQFFGKSGFDVSLLLKKGAVPISNNLVFSG